MHADLTDASVHVPADVLAPRRQSIRVPPPDLAANANPTYDEIAERALELFAVGQATGGQNLQDWVNAERQLRFERQRTAGVPMED
jgi:hypothetical protein